MQEGLSNLSLSCEEIEPGLEDGSAPSSVGCESCASELARWMRSPTDGGRHREKGWEERQTEGLGEQLVEEILGRKGEVRREMEKRL